MCSLALPAKALEYSISAPGHPRYGKATSFEPVASVDGGAMKNEDLSKNVALIPPGFGTPTSYVLNTGEYFTPNLVLSQMAGAGTVNGSTVSIALPSVGTLPSTSIGNTEPPNTGSVSTAPSTTAGFTEVTNALYYSDGSLGTLKIPSISLTVKIYQGTDTAALAKGAGHFTNTSIWAGNIALAGHNRGVNNHFC
ncbi:MAG: sortase [Oscillospiraceae bacterium]|nr:sortase [Oscillospiraceae bacterium]